jgi:hypothetical protein
LYDGIYGSVQLFATLEENQLYDEQILERLASLLSDELACGLCGTAYQEPSAYGGSIMSWRDFTGC